MKTLTFSVNHGDALAWLKTLPSDSVDSLICDPPSGIGFMKKKWDLDKGGRDKWIAWLAEILKEAYRVLKPGGHGLVWAIPRTSHWTGMACEYGGFEVRDRLSHIFGSGMPKSHNVSKAIDKKKGVERPVIGTKTLTGNAGTSTKEKGGTYTVGAPPTPSKEIDVTGPGSPEAEEWEGFGSGLKPALEDWWLIRKPLKQSIADNVLEHGTGALNLGETKVDGRCTPHLLLTHHALCDEQGCVFTCPTQLLDRQSGIKTSGVSKGKAAYPGESVTGFLRGHSGPHNQHGGTGGASRFYPRFHYFPKPSKAEKEAGLDELPLKAAKKWNPGGIQKRRDEKAEEEIKKAEVAPKDIGTQGLDARGRTLVREDGTKTLVARFVAQHRANIHPTVKSIELMRWLIRLITPPGGTVMDPFTGSGTTGCGAVLEGMSFLGTELDAENEGFVQIALMRMEFWASYTEEGQAGLTAKQILTIEKNKDERQISMF